MANDVEGSDITAERLQALEQSEHLRQSRLDERAAHLVVEVLRDRGPSRALVAELGVACGGYEAALRFADSTPANTVHQTVNLHALRGRLLDWLGDDEDAMDLLSGAVPPNEMPMAQTLELGLLLQRRGDDEAAIECFNDALAQAPNFIEARVGLAASLSQLGRGTEALKVLGERLDDARLAVARADVLGKMGKSVEALRLIESTLNSYHRLAPAVALKASIIRSLGRRREAYAILKRYLDNEPDNEEVLFALSGIALELGDADEALKSLNVILSATPDDVYALADIAYTLIAASRYDDAEEALDAALVARPQSIRLMKAQASLDWDRERFHDAAATYAKILAKTPDDIGALTGKASALQAAYQYDAADDLLGEAVATRPDNMLLLKAQASLAWARERYDDAIAVYDKVLAKAPDDLDALIAKASVLEGARRYGDADQLLKAALMARPQSIRLMKAQASLAWARERYDDAIATYDKVLAESPDDLDALTAKASVLQAAYQYDAADDLLGEAVATRPDNMLLLKAQGSLAWARERYDDAIAVYDKVLAKAPDDLDALIAKASVLEGARRYGDADQLLKAALMARPQSIRLIRAKASLAWARERYDDAISAFDEVLAVAPDDVGSVIGKASVLQAARRYEAADRLLSTAVEASPHSVHMMKAQASLAWARERHDDAIAIYDRVLASAPEDLDALTTKASILQAARQYDAAEALLREAAADGSETLSLQRATAWLEWFCFREVEALDRFEKMTKNHPDDGDALYGVAACFDWLGRPGAAELTVGQALERQSSDSRMHLLAARLAFNSGRYRDARRHSDEALREDPKGQEARRLSKRLTLRGVYPSRLSWVRRRVDARAMLAMQQRSKALALVTKVEGVDSLRAADASYSVERMWRRLSLVYAWEAVLVPAMAVVALLASLSAAIATGVAAYGFSPLALVAHGLPTAVAVASLFGAAYALRPALGTVLRWTLIAGGLLTITTGAFVVVSDTSNPTHIRFGLLSGLEALTISVWIFVVLAMARSALFEGWRTHLRHSQPEAFFVGTWCQIRHDLASEALPRTAASRASIAGMIEDSAKVLERGLRRSLRTGSGDVDGWTRRRCAEMALAVRDLKPQTLSPGSDTWQDLMRAADLYLRSFLVGQLDDLPRLPLTQHRLLHRETLGSGMRILVAALLPFLMIAVIQRTPFSLTGSTFDWAVGGAAVWLAVSLLIRLDPLFVDKVGAVRDVLSIPQAASARPSSEQKGSGQA